MASYAWFLLIMVQVVLGSEQQNVKEGLFNKLSNGMKIATDFLASESMALKVAEFVVRAFQTTPSKRRPPFNDPYGDETTLSEETFSDNNKPILNKVETMNSMTPLKHLVKLFGLQPNQITAVAVNALVFVAQMISTFLSGPKRPSMPYRSEDPATWILNKNSRTLQEIISTAKNESLTEIIQDLIKKQGSEEETSCIRLLVCKITPFVSRMQKAVFGEENNHDDAKDVHGVSIMYRHLPLTNEIKNRSDICEQQHGDCDLNE